MKNFEDHRLGDLHRFTKGHRLPTANLEEARNFRITLKQWKMLHAVVDCGSFAEAAEFLHISQSAISYTLSKLQEQLGISVLKIEGRKAQLTTAGQALLEKSRHLLRDAVELELFAENLRHGVGSDVRLAIDQDFPTDLLMATLRKVSELRWNIRVSLVEMGLPQAEKALFERAADLAITARVPSGFHGSPLIELEYVAVARPDHALFKLDRDIGAAELERQVQIVVAGSDEAWQTANGRPASIRQRWNVNSFETAVGVLCEGMGYAWLPRHRVDKWLEKGELATLPLHRGRACKTYLYLIYGLAMTPGSSVSAFADLLQSVAASARENRSQPSPGEIIA